MPSSTDGAFRRDGSTSARHRKLSASNFRSEAPERSARRSSCVSEHSGHLDLSIRHAHLRAVHLVNINEFNNRNTLPTEGARVSRKFESGLVPGNMTIALKGVWVTCTSFGVFSSFGHSSASTWSPYVFAERVNRRTRYGSCLMERKCAGPVRTVDSLHLNRLAMAPSARHLLLWVKYSIS